MKLALDEAKLAYSKKEVPVGAVLVKDDEVISRSYNQSISKKDPSGHAEMNVLRDAANKVDNYRLNGASLYVTLEPCSHFGLTPPCTNKIISRKIGRVYFSIKDPDIRSYNKSSKILKKKGVFELLDARPCRIIQKFRQKLSFGPEMCEIDKKYGFWHLVFVS